jgi:type I restriction enzyme S subunit
MPAEWRLKRLGELTDNFDNIRVPVKESDRRPGPFPYYGASGVVDHVDGYLFDGEYLLVAEDGENLRTRNTPVAFLARGRFWVNNHAHIIRGNRNADTRFLMYALTVADIDGFLTGSTMPKLTQGNMNRIPIFSPPFCEQRAIARILGALDDKIELNRQMNETLEAMARALFKSWFVDFDPVRAKADGRDRGLPASIAELFPNRFVECELGELPEGWDVSPLETAADLLREQTNPFDFHECFFHHYSIPAFDNYQHPSFESGSGIKSMKFRVQPGTILFSKLNPDIDRIWIPDPMPDERAVCSTEFLVLRPKPPFGRGFIYCLLRSAEFREAVRALTTGTSNSHQRARADAVMSVSMPLPPATLVHHFETLAEPIVQRVLAGRRECRTLSAVRDLLLPKLISGELRVEAVERLVAEVAA